MYSAIASASSRRSPLLAYEYDYCRDYLDEAVLVDDSSSYLYRVVLGGIRSMPS